MSGYSCARKYQKVSGRTLKACRQGRIHIGFCYSCYDKFTSDRFIIRLFQTGVVPIYQLFFHFTLIQPVAIYRKILYTYNKEKYVEQKGCLNNMYKKIIQLAEDITPELVRQRRDFHKYPETRWTEMRTASIIAGKLTELGYEVLIGEQVCNGEARGNLPSDEVLEQEYQRAIAQGADPKFVEATKGGL
ncbi:MAG: hypothetical protein E7395_04875, partial [Ruminococcaceae bacterium]|nr:hypothetical protein [Oscillospiraceae bacterium]